MNTEIISFAAIGLVLIILGLVTWKKQTTVFLHSYHYKKVKEENIPAYTRLMGIGQIIIGAGFCLTAVLKLFVQGPFSWAFLIAGLAAHRDGCVGMKTSTAPGSECPRGDKDAKGGSAVIQNLKLTILMDNIAQEPLVCEWGLSMLIEADGRKILLDTGASGQFIRNAELLRTDLSEVDVGILSHAHYDHADGMEAFFACNDHAEFFLRQGCRENCFGIKDGVFRYNGIRKGTLERFADRIHFVSGVYPVAEGIWLLGHRAADYSQIAQRNELFVVENGMDEQRLCDAALRLGVRVWPISPYFMDAVPEPYRACVLLGYGNLTSAQMRRGVTLLAKAWGLDDF